MYGYLSKLARTTPKFMVAAYRVEFDNKDASKKCLREYLKSLFTHVHFRQMHIKKLESCILPIMEANIDLVCELMFRDVEFASALPPKFLEVPRVAMSILHRSSRCEDDTTFPWTIFPWHFLTHKVFFESYINLPNITPPFELFELINDKFPEFLSTGENIEWTKDVFLGLIRRIHDNKRLPTDHLPCEMRLLILTITKAIELEASIVGDRIVGRAKWLRKFAYVASTAVAQTCPNVAHIIGLLEHIPRNEYLLNLLRNIAIDRPVHLSDCLIACGENTEMMQRLVGLFIRGVASKRILGDGNGSEHSIRYDRANIYDMLSVWRMPNTPPTVNLSISFNWFCSWTANASESDTLAFIGSFQKDFQRDPELTPIECVHLLPATWRETPSSIRKLLTIDWRTLPGLVLEFDQANTSIILSEKREVLEELGWECRLRCRSHGHALSSEYASITTSAMPKFTRAMVACFSGPAARPPITYRCKLTEAICFAYRIASICDDVAACTAAIFGSRASRLNVGTVLCLLPCHLHAILMQDRSFLLKLAAKLPFEISRLPLPSRYDAELIELAIGANPRCATMFDDPSQLLATRNVFDILLSSDVEIPVRDDAGVPIRNEKGKPKYHAVACWAFDLLPEAQKNNPAIACSIIADERLSVDCRKTLYNSSFPMIVKHNERCKVLACKFFGPSILVSQSDTVELNDPLSQRLLAIVHDGYADSVDVHRGQNSAYLRSLSIDLRDAFMPEILVDHVNRPSDGVTYKTTIPDWFPTWNSVDLTTCTFESPTSYEVYQKMCGLNGFLENISNVVSMILQPRRRAHYPSGIFCEKFEGVQVEFRCMDGNTTPTLVTKAGSKPVHIPDDWKQAMTAGFQTRTVPEFWGILFAGYGQRSKATKLKNGTLSADSDWSGVTIKIYETFPFDCGSYEPAFFKQDVVACQSFLQCVELHQIAQYMPTALAEESMMKVHRESVKKGGLGIVFRDVLSPNKFVSYDAHGYTVNAEKIVGFLHKYPLHILSKYMHEAEMLGCEDYENPEADDMVYPDISKVFQDVIKQMRPTKLKRKARTGSSASKKKAYVAASSTSKPSYWDDSDGSVSSVSIDGEVSDVSSGEVSEFADSDSD